MQVSTERHSNIPVLLAILAAVLGAYGAWYWYTNWTACGRKRIDQASQRLTGIATRWDDANKLASTTSRIALATPVAELQEIKREANSLSVPACLSKAKADLVSSMNATIDAYLTFMGDASSDIEVQGHFREANARQTEWVRLFWNGRFARQLRRLSGATYGHSAGFAFGVVERRRAPSYRPGA